MEDDPNDERAERDVEFRVFLGTPPGAKKPGGISQKIRRTLNFTKAIRMAPRYGITTSPEVIEEGYTAGMESICRLIADGHVIKIPHFNVLIGVEAEGEGSEGVPYGELIPLAIFQANPVFRKNLRGRVSIVLEPIIPVDGFIGKVIDNATGLTNESLTPGNALTIYGFGLKIKARASEKDAVGLTFMNITNGLNTKAEDILVNKKHVLVVTVPPTLTFGVYKLRIETYSKVKGWGLLLKEKRQIESEFTLTVNG